MGERAKAIVAIFGMAADLVEREGHTYGEWVAEVTRRAVGAVHALDGALEADRG